MKEMLNKLIQSQVSDSFKELKEPVGILLFMENDLECEFCQQTEQMLTEVTALSEKLYLEIFNTGIQDVLATKFNIKNLPTIVIIEKNNSEIVDHGIRFVGIPSGHEFSSLIHSIIMVSRRDSGLRDTTRKILIDLDRPLLLQIFVTPTCPYCPQSVIIAHQLAYEYPKVVAEMIEATEFPDLADQFGISGVPHTVINGGIGSIVGAFPEEIFAQKIGEIIMPD